jgi:hypothetical protein
MPYSISQVTERFKKNNTKINQLIQQIISFTTKTSLFNIDYLNTISMEIQTMEMASIRSKIDVSKEIIDIIQKVVKKEEKRRSLYQELQILKIKEKNRKRERIALEETTSRKVMRVETNPYPIMQEGLSLSQDEHATTGEDFI